MRTSNHLRGIVQKSEMKRASSPPGMLLWGSCSPDFGHNKSFLNSTSAIKWKAHLDLNAFWIFHISKPKPRRTFGKVFDLQAPKQLLRFLRGVKSQVNICFSYIKWSANGNVCSSKVDIIEDTQIDPNPDDLTASFHTSWISKMALFISLKQF